VYGPERPNGTKPVIIAANRVIVPIRNSDGVLVGLTARAWQASQQPKFLHSDGFRRDFCLFGESVAIKGGVGILVEGHLDVLALHQKGWTNTVAVMGSSLSKLQLQKIKTLFTSMVILPDGDEAGAKASAQWQKQIEQYMPCRIAKITEGYDPDDLSGDELWETLWDSSYPDETSKIVEKPAVEKQKLVLTS
jgi:DNA primase